MMKALLRLTLPYIAQAANLTPLETYKKFVAKFNKGTAAKRIQALELIINKKMAAAQRSASRYGDAGPLDIMHEKVAPLENQVELLKWFIKNPTKNPPKNLLDELTRHLKDKESTKQYHQEKKKAFSKFPSLIGYRIFWKSKYGGVKEGTVFKQMPGKWGSGPRYKTKIDGESAIWTIPDSLVTKKVKPQNIDKVIKGLEKQKVKQKETMQSFKVGDEVAWNSTKRHMVMKGKIISVGRTKVKVNVAGARWNVPLPFIFSVNGKKL